MTQIRAVRRRAGLTQAQLAAAAGYTQPQVSAWETGRRTPSVRTLVALAAALAVPVDDLLNPN